MRTLSGVKYHSLPNISVLTLPDDENVVERVATAETEGLFCFVLSFEGVPTKAGSAWRFVSPSGPPDGGLAMANATGRRLWVVKPDRKFVDLVKICGGFLYLLERVCGE